MQPEETSLVAKAFPSKRRSGRKPVRESRRGEILDAVMTWKLMPTAERVPPTLTELAASLGITQQLASCYYKQAPGSVAEFIDKCEREVLQRDPCVLETLTKQAEKGSVEAIKVYMRELASPRRPQQHKQSRMAPDAPLMISIRNLIRPSLETQPSNAHLVVENVPSEESNRQILSNSQADEESMS